MINFAITLIFRLALSGIVQLNNIVAYYRTLRLLAKYTKSLTKIKVISKQADIMVTTEDGCREYVSEIGPLYCKRYSFSFFSYTSPALTMGTSLSCDIIIVASSIEIIKA